MKPWKRVAGTVLALFVVSAVELSALGGAQSPERSGEALRIPPLLQPRRGPDGTLEFALDIQEGTSQFYPERATPTLGYNGAFLGPTIRVRRDDRVAIRVYNSLAEPTTVHWHGAHIPADMDGGPLRPIPPRTAWSAVFTVRQPAATLWYHPHLMGTSAEQVYRGLAGLLIVDDDISLSLPIPKDYGVNDIPLITQEREFQGDGRFFYRPGMPDIQHGYFGNALLVNGAIAPRFPVRENFLRFRILNGSNSTILRYSFDDGSEFHQIASDGGFLEKPVALRYLVLSPGERAEILVDFSRSRKGDTRVLNAETNGGGEYAVLALPIEERADRGFAIPARLVAARGLPSAAGLRVRRFALSSMGMGGNLTINGKRMDLSRVDERIPLGQPEIWELSNQGMGMMNLPHSFHLHDIQFFIVDINGSAPPPDLAGPKDTVLLWPGDRIRILVRFDDYLGKYMYHCHFLEHEDQGMMGILETIAPTGRGD